MNMASIKNFSLEALHEGYPVIFEVCIYVKTNLQALKNIDHVYSLTHSQPSKSGSISRHEYGHENKNEAH